MTEPVRRKKAVITPEKVDPAEVETIETEPVPPSELAKVESEKPEKPQPTYPGKDIQGKLRLSLVPPSIIEAIAAVRTFGESKYGSHDNWREVPANEWTDALYRHLLCYLKDPQAKDPESGMSHLAHMACNLAFMIEMEQ